MSHTDVLPETTEIATKKLVVVWALLLVLLAAPCLYKLVSAVFQQEYVKKGEYATCSDIWGDKFNIAVKDISQNNGILTLSLLVDYNLVDKNDETDESQVTAAIEVFLLESSYLQDGFNAINCLDSSQGILSHISIDEKSAVVSMKFPVDDKKVDTFVVRSYQDLNNLNDTQVREGTEKSADLIKFEI